LADKESCAIAQEVADRAHKLAEEMESVLDRYSRTLASEHGDCNQCAHKIIATALLEVYALSMGSYLRRALPVEEMSEHWQDGINFQHYAAMAMANKH